MGHESFPEEREQVPGWHAPTGEARSCVRSPWAYVLRAVRTNVDVEGPFLFRCM